MPGPPASNSELESFAIKLGERGFVLPPSLRQLLGLHNGIDNFVPLMELFLRSTTHMQHSWVDDVQRSPGHLFVFASSHRESFAGFDPQTLDKNGEMEVVMVENDGTQSRFSNLEEFLREQLAYYESVMKEELAALTRQTQE